MKLELGLQSGIQYAHTGSSGATNNKLGIGWLAWAKRNYLQTKESKNMQVWNYASMHVCEFVSTQVCKYAINEYCKYASMTLCKYAYICNRVG